MMINPSRWLAASIRRYDASRVQIIIIFEIPLILLVVFVVLVGKR
jgi:hypothetical protein